MNKKCSHIHAHSPKSKLVRMWENARRWIPSTPKWKTIKNYNPTKVLNFWDKGAINKHGSNWAFNISLESSWNLDIKGGFIFSIWNYELKNCGQRNGQESNWQFNSQALKLMLHGPNDLQLECATWHWKDLNKSYNMIWFHAQNKQNLKI